MDHPSLPGVFSIFGAHDHILLHAHDGSLCLPYESESSGLASCQPESKLRCYQIDLPVSLTGMLVHDIRFVLRTLRRSPGFAAVAVLMLAVAIGGNSAIFSVVNGVLLKPLPYQEPQRLVRVFGVWPKYDNFPMSPADFLDYRARNHVFSGIALYARRDLDLATRDRPERLAGMAVSAGFFRLLGYEPMLGAAFAIDDEKRQSVAPLILSYRAWRRFFGADRGMIGQPLTLSAKPFIVTAVMPPAMQHVGGDYHSLPHGDNVDFWIPLTLEAGRVPRGSHFLNAIARLNPGVAREQAESEMNVIAAQLEQQYPDTNRDGRIKLTLLQDDIVGNAGTMLWVLLGAVGFVLLIACGNIANLLLARATTRQREVAIRSALGAGRERILRQLLTESLVIAALGGALGMAFAIWGMDAIVALGAGKLTQAVGLDARMLAFTVVVTLATGLLFGFAPALTMVRSNLTESLKEGDRRAGSGRAQKAARRPGHRRNRVGLRFARRRGTPDAQFPRSPERLAGFSSRSSSDGSRRLAVSAISEGPGRVRVL